MPLRDQELTSEPRSMFFLCKRARIRIAVNNMNWARSASYEELDPALYHMPSDPREVNNLAFDKKHTKVAMAMKEKLINIVLGDNRVEVGWGKGTDVTGTEVYRSNFAPGAQDYKLKLK